MKGKQNRSKNAAANRGEFNSAPENIARYAYHIWVKEGRPHGRDKEHWLQAEAHLKRSQGLIHHNQHPRGDE
jgi:Protein of unknown function (DUF2934)